MNRKHQGFTLVELMVAMLLGLLLTLAAVQLFATNQRTFALQQALSSLHEDGQMVIRYMMADIRHAGRGSAVQGTIPAVVFTGSPASLDGGSGNDQLVINYFGLADCQGSTPVATETEIINRYFVDSDNILRCDGNRSSGSVELLPNVESFQVQYGIDTSPGDGVGVTQFVNAGEEGSNPVVAIRFALLLSSGNDSVPGQGGANTYYVLDQAVTPAADNRLRRVFSTTVQLRNYDWDGV